MANGAVAESLLPGLGLRLLCDILQGLEFAPRSGSIRKPRDLGGKHFCSQVPRGQLYLLQINLPPMSLEAKLFALKQIKKKKRRSWSLPARSRHAGTGGRSPAQRSGDVWIPALPPDRAACGIAKHQPRREIH